MTKQLTTTDHISVAIHALFILLSLKLAFTNHMVISMVGWVMAYLNLKAFDVYIFWRVNESRQ